MYEIQSRVVSDFLEFLKRELPSAHAYIESETLAASTGLEYLGILSMTAERALSENVIPKEYKGKVKELRKAIREIYRS